MDNRKRGFLESRILQASPSFHYKTEESIESRAKQNNKECKIPFKSGLKRYQKLNEGGMLSPSNSCNLPLNAIPPTVKLRMKGANSSLPTTKIRSNTPQLDFKLKLFPQNSALIPLRRKREGHKDTLRISHTSPGCFELERIHQGEIKSFNARKIATRIKTWILRTAFKAYGEYMGHEFGSEERLRVYTTAFKTTASKSKVQQKRLKGKKTRNHINIVTENRGHKSKIKVRSHSKEVLQNEIELKYGNFDEERDFLMNTPDLRYSNNTPQLVVNEEEEYLAIEAPHTSTKVDNRDDDRFFPKHLDPFGGKDSKYTKRRKSSARKGSARRGSVRKKNIKKFIQNNHDKLAGNGIKKDLMPLKKFKIYRKKRCDNPKLPSNLRRHSRNYSDTKRSFLQTRNTKNLNIKPPPKLFATKKLHKLPIKTRIMPLKGPQITPKPSQLVSKIDKILNPTFKLPLITQKNRIKSHKMVKSQF
ncbi:unnamed protein product [Moneuplotes crassus]|uniref:Uncharacterized protein n=1 Tax=Euplotes crassus TaxID=5936 RepID=A0AAD1U3Q4_EUPCR|nr:unnamed protein product [Moneuplotes crassus]